MKQSKKLNRLLALLGILVVVCVATFGVMRYEEKKEQIKTSDEIILQISSSTVTALSWDNETESLSFHKDNTWLYDGDEAFPVDEDAINELLALFEEFGVSFVIEDVDDFGQYGLDNPVCKIQITTTTQLDDVKTAEELTAEEAETTESETEEDHTSDSTDEDVDDTTATEDSTVGSDESSIVDDESEDSITEQEETDSSTETSENENAGTNTNVDGYTYEIRLGNFSTMDSQRYISIGDGNVYLVSTDPLDLYDAVLSDMIDHDETPSFEQVNEVSFTGIENYTIQYEEESSNTYCSDDVYFADIDSKILPLDTELVDAYLDGISGLDPTDYVNYKVTDEELADYGLDAPELTMTVGYSYTDEDDANEAMVSDTFVIHVSRNQEQVQEVNEATQKAEEENDTEYEPEEIPAYVRIGDSQIIYEISASDYEALIASGYDDLRHKEVFTADFDKVYQIDISLEDTAYTLTSEVSEENEEETLWYYGEEEFEITSFQSALSDLSADSFTNEEPTDKEEISLRIYLNDENYPHVDIHLYRYDGDHCLAVLDGEPISFVSRSQVVDLIEAANSIILH